MISRTLIINIIEMHAARTLKNTSWIGLVTKFLDRAGLVIPQLARKPNSWIRLVTRFLDRPGLVTPELARKRNSWIGLVTQFLDRPGLVTPELTRKRNSWIGLAIQFQKDLSLLSWPGNVIPGSAWSCHS